MKDTDIARVCHEANRALQNVLGEPCPSVPWDVVSEDTRKSVLQGVDLARQNGTPEEQHEVWLDHKLADGWRYGTVRNEVEKTHPNLVTYGNLPPRERLKDELFLAIVTVLGPA